jgi:ABC-type nitrate/sulfonate/bicarbonate transport system substrate-binding protein
MVKLKLALDWTPNTNHIGFFVAKELGFYSDQNIDLEIDNPLDDNYQLTPGKKLALDSVDFAIAPFETVISLNNKTNPVNAVAIFAILQDDLSSIVTLRSSGLTSPKQLDGKIYASYKARYEDHIVTEMVKNAGGKGELILDYPEKLGIWNTLLNGKADATWIFDNWEGAEAKSKNIQLNKFTLNEFNIPYGYSPIVIARREKIDEYKVLYSHFIQATRKGFLFARQHQSEALDILKRYVPEKDVLSIDLHESLSMTSKHFGDELTCGKMNDVRVTDFLNWLIDKKLEKEQILDQHLFTNELFD